VAVARKPRVHYPGALYHVISRGNQRQIIFRTDADRWRYLELLNDYCGRYQFQLYAYVLMANHVHLLMQVGKYPLAKIMQGLQQSYTLYFNRKYKLVGHLFQGRYKDILCDRDSYLLELVRYIHLNPVRSKIVADPGDYRWSSHGEYLGSGRKRETATVQTEWVLEQFGPGLARARRKYKEFVFDGIGAGHRDDFYEVKEQRFLGDDQFVEKVNRHLDLDASPKVRADLSAIERAVSRRYHYPVETLHSRTKEHRGSFIRAVVAYVGQELGTVKLNEVAARYGRDQVSLSLGLKRLRERLAQEADLSEHIGGLLKELRTGKIKINN
jgi:REP element-mobilizing transposase RayT